MHFALKLLTQFLWGCADHICIIETAKVCEVCVSCQLHNIQIQMAPKFLLPLFRLLLYTSMSQDMSP